MNFERLVASRGLAGGLWLVVLATCAPRAAHAPAPSPRVSAEPRPTSRPSRPSIATDRGASGGRAGGAGAFALRGRVLSADGAPASGVLVAIAATDDSSAPPRVVATDETGSFSIPLRAAGSCLLAAATERGSAAARFSIGASANGAADPVELRLGAPDAGTDPVRLLVVDEVGAPRPGQLVFLTASASPGWTWAARADSEGRVVVAVPGEGIAWYEDEQTASAPVVYGPGLVSDGTLIAAARAALDQPAPAAFADWATRRFLALFERGAVTEAKTVGARGDGQPKQDGAEERPRLLANVFEGAAIVGLGTQAPGVHEGFSARGALTRELIARADIRVLLWEAPWAAMLAINRYVRTGAGDPGAALASMGWWPWDVAEALAFIDELRELNRGRRRSRRVHLLGTGANRTRRETDHVLAALEACAPGRLAGARRALAPLRDPRPKTEALILDAAGYERYRAALADLRGALSGRRMRRCLGAERQALVQLSVVALEHAADMRETELERGPLSGIAARERALASSIVAIADALGDGRAVVWAHNDRVGRGLVDGAPAAGWHLARRRAHGYLPIALVLGLGELRAYDRRPGRSGDAVVTVAIDATDFMSLSRALAAGAPDGVSAALLDLRSVPEGPARDFVHRATRMRSFGGSYAGPGDAPVVVPGAAYDALVFVPRASPTSPTPTGVRPPPAAATGDRRPGASAR